ncbi:hypothetical protein BH10ACT8_BH10ACT8_18070 [soil metagenome]
MPDSLLSMAGRAGAYKSWANTADPAARTRPGRQKFLDRFLDEVDPDRVLAPEDRERRATQARKAYMASLALKSAMARRRR